MDVCIPYNPGNSGGPSVFAKKFSHALAQRQIQVTYTWSDDCDVLLAIISAHPSILLRAKRHRVPVVQRLDGVYYPAIAGRRWRRLNLPIWITYRFFADRVIFQSQYSQRTCERFMGQPRCPSSVIHNGVDLGLFNPRGEAQELAQEDVILFLLSTIRDSDLLPVIEAYDRLHARRDDLRLAVLGKLAPSAQHRPVSRPDVVWTQHIPNERLPAIYRGAHLMVSAKLRQNCPNAVLESIACGLPVACFDSGAHRELIGDEAGVCVPLTDDYGPLPALDAIALAEASERILQRRGEFAQGARRRAEQRFDLERMTERYLEVFADAIQSLGR